jgi:hypothetical protein
VRISINIDNEWVDNDTKHIICIIDKSGSMYSLTSDTIGGFNTFISQQKNIAGKATMSVTLFDTVFSTYYSGPIGEVPVMTKDTYVTGGATALYDAIGKTLSEYKDYDKALVLIMTDGEENSSKEYHRSTIADMIKEREAKGWKFIYLGANQDAFQEGSNIGITQTYNFVADSPGIRSAFTNIGTYTTAYRGGPITTDATSNPDPTLAKVGITG